MPSWTQAEIEDLKENYSKGLYNCKIALERHTEEACRTIARRDRIRGHSWTEEEDAEVLSNFVRRDTSKCFIASERHTRSAIIQRHRYLMQKHKKPETKE